MITPEAKVIVLHAIANNLTVKQMLQNLEPHCKDGSKLYVKEECGFTGYAFTDCNMALFAMFALIDDIGSSPVAEQILEPFSVALIDYDGNRYYRFSEDMDVGSSCGFDSMIGDLEWIDPDWVLVENFEGIFIQKGRLESSEK